MRIELKHYSERFIMVKKIRKIGYSVGWAFLFLSFFVGYFFVLGFLFFGVMCLYNYYFNGGKKDLINCWAEDIIGFYCLIMWAFYQFKLMKFVSYRPITIFVIILLIIKYFYIKKKAKSYTDQIKRHHSRNIN